MRRSAGIRGTTCVLPPGRSPAEAGTNGDASSHQRPQDGVRAVAEMLGNHPRRQPALVQLDRALHLLEAWAAPSGGDTVLLEQLVDRAVGQPEALTDFAGGS